MELKTEIKIPERFAIFVKMLVPHYGLDETGVVCRVIQEFIANNREELEKGPCSASLKFIENRLSKISFNELATALNDLFTID